MANYMAEVAKLLGVEIGEEFEIEYPSPCSVKTTAVFYEAGFKILHTDAYILHPYWQESELHGLLKGTLAIKRKPWKPKINDAYWFICVDKSAGRREFEGCLLDIYNYKLGNCYRTEKEAISNRDKWVSFYVSDEVLEV